MGRRRRNHQPTGFYHVMARGNNGQVIFFSDKDRSKLNFLMHEAIKKFECRIHGFCFMSNHIHLIIQVGSISLSRIMQHVTSAYAKYVNAAYDRKGHLFQGRFRSILIDEEKYLSELTRYIHLNPVRAGLVHQPEDYLWSSHRVYIGIAALPWLHQDWILKKFHEYELPARRLFAEYVKRGITREQKAEIESYLSCNQARLIVDNDEYGEHVRSVLHKNTATNFEISIDELVNIVGEVVQIQPWEIKSPGKLPQFARARSIIVWIARRQGNWSLRQIAEVLGKNASALSRLASQVDEHLHIDHELANTIDEVQRRIANRHLQGNL